MSTAAVGQCPQCHSVVNVHWPSCLVCHALVPPPIQAHEGHMLAPGAQIRWMTAKGTQKGVIDFVHVYPGELWAFCTKADGGWSAVNAKYCDKAESS